MPSHALHNFFRKNLACFAAFGVDFSVQLYAEFIGFCKLFLCERLIAFRKFNALLHSFEVCLSIENNIFKFVLIVVVFALQSSQTGHFRIKLYLLFYARISGCQSLHFGVIEYHIVHVLARSCGSFSGHKLRNKFLLCHDYVHHVRVKGVLRDVVEYADLAELVAQYGVWVYAILFLILFCETGLVVTPFLPGDSLLFVAGALASLETNDLNVHMMVVLMLIAAIVGDAVNYTIGRLFGEKLFSNPNSKIFRRSYLDKTHQFYEKHGGKTIILARFVPIVRTFAPFVAGMGHMSYRHFAAYNVIGALLWVLLFTYAGYFFGTIPMVQDNLKLLIVGIIVVSILPGVIEIIRHKRAAARAAK